MKCCLIQLVAKKHQSKQESDGWSGRMCLRYKLKQVDHNTNPHIDNAVMEMEVDSTGHVLLILMYSRQEKMLGQEIPISLI